MFSVGSVGLILTGAFFGFTAGISPGPLLTLVISQTLTHGKTEGIKVAIAPLITDLPIIILAFAVFSRYSQVNIIMGLISFLGGIFLVYLGYECLTTKGLDINVRKSRAFSLIKGVISNILNPHPYLFWITVGIPVALKAFHSGTAVVILYFLSFYLMLIGSKVIVALLVERSRSILNNNSYIFAMRILGICLAFFAVIFFSDSYKILKDIFF